jgi:signal transduction histidine kinase
MKTHLNFSFFFLFFPLFLFSQNKWESKIINKRIKKESVIFSSKIDFKKALSFYLQQEWDSTLIYASKQLNVKTQEKELENYCFFFRGYSFQQKKMFEESKQEFNKITYRFQFYDVTKMYLGELALEQKNFKKAITYFKEIEKLDLESLFGIKRSIIFNNIGTSYLHLKDYSKSELYLGKAVKLQEKEGDPKKLVMAYGNVANLYYIQYKDDQAISYFQKAYKLSKEVQDFDVKRRATKNMAVVEENRKDFQKALKYRKEYEQWKDSLNDQNRIYETAQLEKKIAVAQKQKEVNVLEAENKLKEEQNKVFLYTGILLFVLLIILFTSYKGKVKRNKIISAQKEELDDLNATKDNLFSIVSHDLRSSVNAIKTSNKNLLDNLEEEDSTDLKEIVQQNSAIVNGAYGLLDNLLNWSLLQTQQSYFEITSMRLYTIVEHVAYNYKPMMLENNITFENKVDKKGMIQADQESLKIILRNLLDNAIKFSKAEGSIQVCSQENNTFYDLVVEDSGIGMDASTIKELLKDTQLLSKKKNEDILGTGLGLHLVKSMIEKNQGKFAIESTLEKGTKMIVSFPKTV